MKVLSIRVYKDSPVPSRRWNRRAAAASVPLADRDQRAAAGATVSCPAARGPREALLICAAEKPFLAAAAVMDSRLAPAARAARTVFCRPAPKRSARETAF